MFADDVRNGNATPVAVELHRRGLDVYVTGITAYSTLCWYSDLLSTKPVQDETGSMGLATQNFTLKFALTLWAAASDPSWAL